MIERLLLVFGLILGVLVALNWINLAIRGFSDFLADAQSIGIFFQYALYVLPNSIYRTLALAAFAASVYVAYRMYADQEMSVLHAAGVTPARLMMPFVMFGVLSMVLTSVLVHEVVPDSRASEAGLRVRVQSDISQIRIRTGKFLFPMDRAAVFAEDVTEAGQSKNLFIHYVTKERNEVTYFAENAELSRSGEDTLLNLNSGHIQIWEYNTKQIRSLNFDSIRFNLSELSRERVFVPLRIQMQNTVRLMKQLYGNNAVEDHLEQQIKIEVYRRIALALAAALFPILGAAALVAGNARGQKTLPVALAFIAVIVLYLLAEAIRDKARAGSFPPETLFAPAAIATVMSLILVASAMSFSKPVNKKRG